MQALVQIPSLPRLATIRHGADSIDCMVTIERRVGRLVEIRVKGDPGVKPPFGRVIKLANELGPDAKVVICSDIREADSVSMERADRLAILQRATRERVERAVMLVGERAVQLLVAERVRDTGAGREVVHVARTPAEAVAILQPLLVAAELTRLKQFLDGK
jgi:hypothetical protein